MAVVAPNGRNDSRLAWGEPGYSDDSRFVQQKINLHEFEVRFSPWLCIRFFLLTLLLYATGLLSLAVIIPLESVAMSKNMGFFPSK